MDENTKDLNSGLQSTRIIGTHVNRSIYPSHPSYIRNRTDIPNFQHSSHLSLQFQHPSGKSLYIADLHTATNLIPSVAHILRERTRHKLNYSLESNFEAKIGLKCSLWSLKKFTKVIFHVGVAERDQGTILNIVSCIKANPVPSFETLLHDVIMSCFQTSKHLNYTTFGQYRKIASSHSTTTSRKPQPRHTQPYGLSFYKVCGLSQVYPATWMAWELSSS